MKKFIVGVSVGSLIGITIFIFEDKKAKQQKKADIKKFIKTSKNNIIILASDINKLKSSTENLKSSLPQTTKDIDEIQKKLSRFQVRIEPNLTNIKDSISKLDKTMKYFK